MDGACLSDSLPKAVDGQTAAAAGNGSPPVAIGGSCGRQMSAGAESPCASNKMSDATCSKSSVTLPTGEDLDLGLRGSSASEDDDNDPASSAADILKVELKEENADEDENAKSSRSSQPQPQQQKRPLMAESNIKKETSDKDDEDDGEETDDDSISSDGHTVTGGPNGGEDAGFLRPPCPVSDAKLELALNGQEPTVRNLIMAAIGVMKSRKARPDTKRICNWIHRRYGKPYMSISDELERLVIAGELARVDYKGSVSFRISKPGGRAGKRRRKKAVSKPGPGRKSSQQLQSNTTPRQGEWGLFQLYTR